MLRKAEEPHAKYRLNVGQSTVRAKVQAMSTYTNEGTPQEQEATSALVIESIMHTLAIEEP